MESQELPHRLKTLLKRFEEQPDRRHRLLLLLELANQLPAFAEADRIPENAVSGCQSKVYVCGSLVEGRLSLRGDADASLIKGLLALLLFGFEGEPVESLLETSPAFIERTGLHSMTPSRSNGFFNVFQKLQTIAKALSQNHPVDG